MVPGRDRRSTAPVVGPIIARRERVTQRLECELAPAAQVADVGAFEELAGAHTDRLYALVLRLVGDHGEAEDVVQETLLRAWRGVGRSHGRATFSTWLYRIAVSESIRALERRLRRVPAGRENSSQVPAPEHDGPGSRAEQHALGAALELAIADLSPPCRTAIVLRDLEGLSTREAANVIGVGEAAFKSRLHEARLKVRASLGDDALISATSCAPTHTA
jgi:RNA polymerase sigma-70 factor (ECF subfamily)